MTLAIESKQKPYDSVLTSSMTEESAKGFAVTESDLDIITSPTLITAHQSDGCQHTPPEGAETIKEMLTSARKVEVKIFVVAMKCPP